MPARYEAIRDSSSMRAKYKTEKLRKKHAAMIENSIRRKEGKPPAKFHKS